MRIKQLHKNFIMPVKATKGAGAFDIYMPEPGLIFGSVSSVVGLGFSAAVPEGYVALLMPRSGVGFKHGVELNNTVGVIDSDFTGEWKASLRTKTKDNFSWNAGDRILQFMIVPIADVQLELIDELEATERGDGGFGSSGK